MKSMMALSALCVLASGNVKADQKNAPPKIGTLIVYRRWNLIGSGGSFPFCVNGGPVIKPRNGCYYKMELPVGDYVLTQRWWSGITPDPQTVHVTAGQTIYFSYSAAPMWQVFEVASDQEDARQTVSHMKQQN